LFLINLIYSFNYIVVKEITPSIIHPLGLHFFRVAMAGLFFTVLVQFSKVEKVKAIDLLKIAGAALFGAVINGGLFLKGMTLTNPINASLLIIMVPIIVLALSYFIFKETIGLVRILGLILGVGGAAILITKLQPLNFGAGTIKGDILILLNAISFGIYLILVKDLMRRYNAITMARWIFTFAFIYMIPIGFRHIDSIEFNAIEWYHWFLLAYVIFLPTCLAFYLYNIALQHVSATVASSYIFLQPLLTAIIAIALGKDELDQFKIVGGSLIFIGVFLVTQHKRIFQEKIRS